MIIQDFLNRRVEVTSTPQRIISLVPSQTELMADLGFEKQIVGITKFCVHPKYLKSTKTIVGGTKQVHFDKIEALQPDIIFCNKEENTKPMVERLQNIATVHISDIQTLEDNIKLIKDYGEILNAQTRAENIIETLQQKQHQFQQNIKHKPIQKVAYLIWRDPWMAVGGNTFINHILELNRFKNVFADQDRYPTIDINNLPDLDLLFLSSEPYPFKTKHFPEIPTDQSKIKLVNGEYFSWYGSRMLKAFDYFKENLH
ncbi:ABC transporter substrate-binding protein [Flavobacteriaceae bacterium 14752]|uniref:ABC transporter substrate-binding protein n=1 Tax=Mesohalobacter salilacus TaxID=2491711 RepID=UPI000F63FAE8|nr:cobalamin-binding protein [Flavobacteriaceae bacterium 14752]